MRSRLQISLLVMLAAIGMFGYESEAAGQAKAVTKAINHQIHNTILVELHQAKHLLDLGLHDYHGHRAKADHEINQTIRLLEHHHKGDHKKAHQAHVKMPHHDGPITPERQAQSDTRLRQAEKLVQAAHLALHQLHTRHGHQHHQEAAHLLTKAVREIEHALHVVNNYNAHHKKALVVK